jgi:glycosyltransferase involved in cell wall biosynthesis
VFKRNVLKDRADHFIMLYVSRNARRKMPSDILVAWKMFLENLQAKHGHTRATLLMHTDPLDREGANLHHVVELLQLKDNVIFSSDRARFEEMVHLYNACDSIVNISSNEGFGLGTLEAMMCGKPIIALKTGGLTRQVEDSVTGEQYGIALEPEVRSLVGNQLVPFIWEDLVSHKTVADAFMKMYDLGPEGREALGKRALEHAYKDYDMSNVVQRWDETLTETIENWRNRYQTWSHVEL